LSTGLKKPVNGQGLIENAAEALDPW